MGDKPPKDPKMPPVAPETLETRAKARRDNLVGAVEQAKLQFNVLQNQLYLLDDLLNPQPADTGEEDPPKGVDPGPGRI